MLSPTFLEVVTHRIDSAGHGIALKLDSSAAQMHINLQKRSTHRAAASPLALFRDC